MAIVDVFHRCTQQAIIVSCKFNGLSLLLLSVYVSTNYRERRVLWHEVSNLIKQGTLSLVVGDLYY